MSPQSAHVYLDHNATTPCRPEVVDEVARVLRDQFGNPGSRHSAGRAARRVLESARERIAEILGAEPREVLFTSGGTESINTAICGLAADGPPGEVALTPGEHQATVEAVRLLQSQGWTSSTIPIDEAGRIRTGAVESLPWDRIRLVTVLLAHNETGVIQDLSSLAARCEERTIPLHIDAVQAVGKIAVNFRALRATALSLAAHKFNGPRGIGALLLRAETRLIPLLRGGHQEQDRRAGTEPVALAAGMALALELWNSQRREIGERTSILRDRLQAGLQAACAPVVVIGHPQHRLPNTLNLAFPGCDGEALLIALDLEGVCCSMGSTCASGSSEPAAVLVAMGLPADLHRSCLRFSVGLGNDEAQIDEAIRRISGVVSRLRRPL